MQDNVKNIITVKEMYNSKMKERREKGITLIALVITIIVLIVLAGIAISMTVGENGIFTKAKEAKRLQITAEAKEKIGTDILDAQIEATQKDEKLQQSKVEEIIAKYGELQADGDTIKLKDNGYEISLKEIYNGSTSSSGGSTGGSTGSAELDSLKAELAQTNATEDKILKDYKVYSNGKLMTGTMENYAGQTQEVTSTSDDTYTYLSIPNAGYYGTDSKLKTLNSSLGNELLPIMTSISQFGITLSTNASLGTTNLLNICDNSNDTYYEWKGLNTNIEISFDTPNTIKQVILNTYKTYDSLRTFKYDVQGYDGTTWDSLLTGAYSGFLYSLNNTKKYTILRFTMTNSKHADNTRDYTYLSQLQIFS